MTSRFFLGFAAIALALPTVVHADGQAAAPCAVPATPDGPLAPWTSPKPLTAAGDAQGHGPACTGIRKIVDFPLLPGRYTLQLSGSESARIGMLVVRLP